MLSESVRGPVQSGPGDNKERGTFLPSSSTETFSGKSCVITLGMLWKPPRTEDSDLRGEGGTGGPTKCYQPRFHQRGNGGGRRQVCRVKAELRPALGEGAQGSCWK